MLANVDFDFMELSNPESTDIAVEISSLSCAQRETQVLPAWQPYLNIGMNSTSGFTTVLSQINLRNRLKRYEDIEESLWGGERVILPSVPAYVARQPLPGQGLIYFLLEPVLRAIQAHKSATMKMLRYILEPDRDEARDSRSGSKSRRLITGLPPFPVKILGRSLQSSRS